MKYIVPKKEVIFAFLIVVVYTFFAFFQLGDTHSIQTFYRENAKDSTQVEIQFKSMQNVRKVMVFLGPKEKQMLTFRYKDENHKIKRVRHTVNSVFTWDEFDYSMKANSVMLILPKSCDIGEIAFIDNNNHVISVENVPAKFASMFDEKSLVPAQPTYKNSFYFDEVYHGRTAYEFIHGLSIYEWTHPPLGKLIIAVGVLLFGPTPFGFRCMGTLFGVLMLPLMYLFAKRMFRSSNIALVCMTLLALDFMHFTQTRIATVDSYLVFFLLASFYFMYRYLTEDRLKPALINFGLSGLFWGLAICVKWNGFYSGLALFAIFIFSLKGKLKNAFHEKKKSYIIGILSIGLLCFIIIPATFYLLCFIPMVHGTPSQAFQQFLNWQALMYHYHSTLNATHPFSSLWWQWPIMMKPLFYYTQTFPNGLKAGMDLFGNPVVWWGGMVAFAFCLFAIIKYRSKNAAFLVIGYVLSYLPWVFITRLTFIYHYFPMTIFCVLMIGATLHHFKSTALNRTVIALALVLFIMYYPIITGIPTSPWYVDTFLRWIPIAF